MKHFMGNSKKLYLQLLAQNIALNNVEMTIGHEICELLTIEKL